MSSVEERRDHVALVLAIGVALAVNLLMFAVLWDALRSESPGLSENATQVISTAFGGMLGVLGSYLGFKAGRHEREVADDEREEPTP